MGNEAGCALKEREVFVCKEKDVQDEVDENSEADELLGERGVFFREFDQVVQTAR